ncbi:MAG: hypothetical protein SGI88_13655 [Candidatus Hydrogenedentes bacterium]|nr:hypothetical protein [Candidatus Hydrogenedentota bacterium]
MDKKSEHSIRRYRRWYATLLRLYSKPYHERFSEEMEQTFTDQLRERAADERGVVRCALWMFAETFMGIVRQNMSSTMMKNKRIVVIVFVVACILMAPFVAMQFTDEVTWSLLDFVAAGGLLLGAGLTYEFISRLAGNTAYKAAVAVAVATGLILVWINLAVGIIGSENNSANLMYFGVLQIGFIGAIIARLQPRGMARAMYATAIGQALAPVIALFMWNAQGVSAATFFGGAGVLGVFVLNTFFVAMWIASATLFHSARVKPKETALPG